jgi:geranylgeranyl reductase family protein
VLESKPQPGGKVCCAGIISPECCQSLGIDDSLVLQRVKGARIYSPSGKTVELWRNEEQACVVDRAALDKSLAERAMAAGVEYSFDSRVEKIDIDDESVTAKVAGNGSGHKARVAVIASGFGAKLTETLGLGAAGDYVVGAQAEVTADVDEIEVFTGSEVAPGFFGWIVPAEPQKALVGLMVRKQARQYLDKLVASLIQQGKVAHNGNRPGCRGITLKPPRKTYGKRLIVVGDAAGQVKPATGGGIYFGMLSAQIAARHLQQALASNDLSSRKLSGYEKEWKERLGREIRIGYWARRFYEKLSDRKLDRVFDIINDSGLDEALIESEDISFDWHGKAIIKMAGQRAMSRLSDIVRLPAWMGKS